MQITAIKITGTSKENRFLLFISEAMELLQVTHIIMAIQVFQSSYGNLNIRLFNTEYHHILMLLVQNKETLSTQFFPHEPSITNEVKRA